MSLRKEVYPQLENVVNTNSSVDLNDYSLLDKWSMIHQKTVIVYTFDNTIEYYKVEYKTPNLFLPFIEILKTSIDDIVIAYNPILDKDVLLKKLYALYKPSQEELALVRQKRKADDTLLNAERDERSVKVKIEERLKQTDEHVAKHLSWTQLTHPMKIHVRTCTDCFPAFYTDECLDTGYRASTFNAHPQFKHSFQKYFYGTPFRALMISINNFEKYHWGDCQNYEKELSILDHIKYHNPRVKELHKG